MADPQLVDVPTDHGPARAHVHPPTGARPADQPARGAVVLGHGAGGGVGAPDLLAVTEVATTLGLVVVLVEQPYRVAGRRGSPRPPVLDAGWVQTVDHLREGVLADLPLVVGGRSAGARVACRTAVALGACGALCLAFPLQPPGRSDRPSRLPELDGSGVPTLVVQGERDPYGCPPDGADRTVVVVRGDHSLKSGITGVRDAVGPWLEDLLLP